MYKHCLVVKYNTHTIFKRDGKGSYHEIAYTCTDLHIVYRVMRSYREQEKQGILLYNVSFELYPYDGTIPHRMRIDWDTGEVETEW